MGPRETQQTYEARAAIGDQFELESRKNGKAKKENEKAREEIKTQENQKGRENKEARQKWARRTKRLGKRGQGEQRGMRKIDRSHRMDLKTGYGFTASTCQ